MLSTLKIIRYMYTVKERKLFGFMLKQSQSNVFNRSSKSILMSHGLPENQLSRA